MSDNAKNYANTIFETAKSIIAYGETMDISRKLIWIKLFDELEEVLNIAMERCDIPIDEFTYLQGMIDAYMSLYE